MGGRTLIRHAELIDGRIVDVRFANGRIVAIGTGIDADGAEVIDGGGGLLLPGLHDHHIHVPAMAAAIASVRCGPPDVLDEQGLAEALAASGEGWLRGIGYHESVAGLIDRHWLDAVAPQRPVRVQHRSGRLWVFNTAGLERLLAMGLPPPPGLERVGDQWTGRLFDEDIWLRGALGSAPPSFARVGADLACYGVTGLTEMGPSNDDAFAQHIAAQRRQGGLPQHVLLAGTPDLGKRGLDPLIDLGPVKLHLHEAHLPGFEEVVRLIAEAHERGRCVAVHCVTEVELVFALAALREAGVRLGDRIEHASVAPDALVEDMAALRLAVVAQPNFVAERGDVYRSTIPQDEWAQLYRLRAFKAAGIMLAGGTDAPFGHADPWAAMAAAVSRRTASGAPLGLEEALTPEEALDLFLADPVDLGRTRILAPGAAADLCLLAKPWKDAREALSAELVRATFIDGRLIHNGIDEAPAKRDIGANAFAGQHEQRCALPSNAARH